MKSFAGIFSMIAALGFSVTACTATYTEAELRSGELERDSRDHSEEERDREIGAEGGIGQEEIDEQEAEAVRESEL